MSKSLRRPAFPLTVTAAVIFAFALCARAAAPAPRAYVNDEAGVMDARTAGELNGVLSELDARAKAQVAVLVVNTLGGADIETYAAAIYKKWGVGDRRTNRGVLLLVAVQDHKARIEVGYGLEGILPDGLTGGIQDKYMVPYFRKGDYSGGVSQGALAIASVIAQDSRVELSAGPAQGGRTDPLPPLTAGQKLLSLLVIGFVIILFIRHPFLMFFLLSNLNSRGGGGGFGRGGFGGFGGGMSGGGGSSRSW
ncbi:MAG: TPM domain-containing protein [Elusimicrobiota bacterium]